VLLYRLISLVGLVAAGWAVPGVQTLGSRPAGWAANRQHALAA
jgi:hypothetical protein